MSTVIARSGESFEACYAARISNRRAGSAATPSPFEALATKGEGPKGEGPKEEEGSDGAKGGSEDEWSIQGVDEDSSASGT